MAVRATFKYDENVALGPRTRVTFSTSGPSYLDVGLTTVHHLYNTNRSATQQLMVVPQHRLTTVGRRAFAVHGPMVWNSLPDDLHA